jgi:hypothetical protein
MNAGVPTRRPRVNGHPVAVCLERHTGPRVSAPRHDKVLGRWSVKPRPLAQDRDAWPPRRAPDDPSEAALQVESRLTHRDKLTPFSPQSPTMPALAPRVDQRRRVGGDHVRRPNRLTSALNNDVPHVLPWAQEHATAL